MSVDLGKLVYKRELDLSELKGRIVAIDAYNVLYQFLSIIRQPDGTPLTGPNGEVTSHLSGLFYRTIDMLEKGIRPIYVFDGVPSQLKQRTNSARTKRRELAQKEYEAAKESGDMELMRSKAMASTRINKEIVESSRELLGLMGIGCIKAPSEGEAQASSLAKSGLAYAAGSQDYDTMLFGAPLVVRNLTFSGRRKLPRKNVYVNVVPEMMSLEETLRALEINRKQLIWLGILIGTDFNEGIDGVGPKTALKIAKSSKDISDVKAYVKDKLNKEFELDIREVEELFEHPEVREMDGKEMNDLLGMVPNTDGVVEFMCDRHGFSKERISKFTSAIKANAEMTRQKGIEGWM